MALFLGFYGACLASCLQAAGTPTGPRQLYDCIPVVFTILWMSNRQQGLGMLLQVAEWTVALACARVIGSVFLVGAFVWLSDKYIDKKTRLTEELKEQIHQACADLNHDAEVMVEKLKFFVIAQGNPEISRELLTRYFATKPHGGKGMVPELVTILFSVLDADNNGTISFAEFAAGLGIIKAAQAGASRQVIHDFAWRALDIDFDGFIEEEELLTWVKILLKLDAIRAEDRVHYGATILPASAKGIMEKYMHLYDTNNDGMISREEFDAVGDGIICMNKVHDLLRAVEMPKNHVKQGKQ